MEMNEGLNCDQLTVWFFQSFLFQTVLSNYGRSQIGQKLCVRAGAEQSTLTSTVTPMEPEPAFECPETVTLVSGDTCHV